MSRRLLVLLIILMSLSLIGIIFVQGYWIKTAVEDKEEQFSNTIYLVLHTVTNEIEKREMKDYFNKSLRLKDSIGELKESNLKEIFYVERDGNNNETFIYSHGILEEDYGISSAFFDNNAADSSTIKNYTSRRTTQIFKEEYGIDGKIYSPVERIEKIGGFSAIEKAAFEDVFKEAANRVPIHKRVSPQEIELLMEKELRDRGIDLNFEYGIYSKGLATRVRSSNSMDLIQSRYRAQIFSDSDGKSNYNLVVSFPDKKKFLISSVIEMAILSMVFTFVILIAYASALYQLIKQKQISEIKTDFINNMTHEFKTPIATINLALDALKNPKASENTEMVQRYMQMIRDENKRMHAQVENVLRISKLEKNQLDIKKDRVDVHEVLEEALAHVELMVENRGGYIKTHLDAKRSEILGNEFHLTNIFVNILDNANKYSPEEPKIEVYTEIVKNSIVVKITDKGAGMSKAVLKRIFEKFYRETTGNIHNIKGHGLGLAYVKSIVEDHQGEVYAESEKDKGSTFFVKLPLI